jgi:4-phosphopantoate--beta-alanine ligase
MIPADHPRYTSLIAREKISRFAGEGIVTLEGLAAHGRGEAFDYLLGEKTIKSAFLAEETAAAMLLAARSPVISVNGNTAALCADLIHELQEASGAAVEVNLFHRTEERVEKISTLLRDNGVVVLSGKAERLLPLSHDRALCLKNGMFAADVILVPLEDGDRCSALVSMGKKVITIDLNPLSRTARTATLTVVDEVTRAIPNISRFCRSLDRERTETLIRSCDNSVFLKDAINEISGRLTHALD